MSIFYFRNLVPNFCHNRNSFYSFTTIDFLNCLFFNSLCKYSSNSHFFSTLSQEVNTFSDHTCSDTISDFSILKNTASSVDKYCNNSSNLPNSHDRFNFLNSQPTQLYKLVLDNYNNLDRLSLLRYVEILQDSNLSDTKITAALSNRLLSDLPRVDSAHEFGYFFRLLEPSSGLNGFFEEVINHIYRNKIYPGLGQPRIWVSYFKFLGSNRIYHEGLYNDLMDMYVKYLDLHTQPLIAPSEIDDSTLLNEAVNSVCHDKIGKIDLGKGELQLNRRFQESVATVIWCLSICSIQNYNLIAKILKILNMYELETSVLIRILWSFSILNVRLIDLFKNAVPAISKLLRETIDESSLKTLAHINQIYSILKSLKHSISPENYVGNTDVSGHRPSSDIDGLMELCKENLLTKKYPQSGKIISKSQKLVSDFLIRANVPHQLEIVTEDLLSIDIRIMLDDEMIALEVDGPTHFLRNIENPKAMTKTGPCLFKKNLLIKSGYKYASIPFHSNCNMSRFQTGDGHGKYNGVHEGWENVREMDLYFKSILMDCDSEKLKLLLSKYR